MKPACPPFRVLSPADLLSLALDTLIQGDPVSSTRDLLNSILQPTGSSWIGLIAEERDPHPCHRIIAAASEATDLKTTGEICLATRLKGLLTESLEANEAGIFATPNGTISAVALPLFTPGDKLTSAFVLPLPTVGEGRAALCCLSRRPDAYVGTIADDLAPLRSLLALQVRTLRLTARLERQEILGSCSRQLVTKVADGACDKELFEFLCGFVTRVFQIDAGIYTLSDDRQWLIPQAWSRSDASKASGPGDNIIRLGEDQEIARMLLDAEIVEIPDLSADAIPGPWKTLARESGIAAALAVPLPSPSGTWGLVALSRETRGPVLLPRERDLLKNLVQQASPLLENSRMVRDLKHSLESFTQRLETSREVSSLLDLLEVPRLVARRAMELTRADEGMVFLLDPDGRTLRPVLALSEYEAEMLNIRCSIGEGIAGYVAQTRTGEYVNRVDLDPRSRHIPGTPSEPEAILAVPLVCADRLIGVMSLYKLGNRRFNDTDLATINIFATQAAIALENASLFQKVAAERSRFSTMIQQMEEAVVFCDSEGRILVINSAARNLMKVEGPVEGQLLLDIAVPEIRSDLKGILGSIGLGGTRNINREFQIGPQSYLGSFTAIHDPQNQTVGCIVLWKDLSEFKAMESQLLQSSKMSAVGQLASGVAHEFNNLIAAIYGYAQFMKDNRDERVLKKGIGIILSSSERARDLTRSLLTFSRNTEGRCEAADVNEVLSDSLLLVEQQIAKEGIRLVRNHGRLPHAWVDRGRLQEVFLNVISNARHAMPDGGTLTLTTSVEASNLIVEVSDTGVGIPSENLERVFDPFFTTKGTLNGARTPGTGLGLFTVYNIVQAHKGQITVRSSKGQGTTVRICLPIQGGLDRQSGRIQIQATHPNMERRSA